MSSLGTVPSVYNQQLTVPAKKQVVTSFRDFFLAYCLVRRAPTARGEPLSREAEELNRMRGHVAVAVAYSMYDFQSPVEWHLIISRLFERSLEET